MLKKKINLTGLFIAIALFSVLLFLPIFDDQKVQRAFALLILVAILWITESIPLLLGIVI